MTCPQLFLKSSNIVCHTTSSQAVFFPLFLKAVQPASGDILLPSITTQLLPEYWSRPKARDKEVLLRSDARWLSKEDFRSAIGNGGHCVKRRGSLPENTFNQANRQMEICFLPPAGGYLYMSCTQNDFRFLWKMMGGAIGRLAGNCQIQALMEVLPQRSQSGPKRKRQRLWPQVIRSFSIGFREIFFHPVTLLP